MTLSVCYLCRAFLGEVGISDDHVIPKTLLTRTQPKVKGFDYAGALPTHTKCNNEFGPETYANKALDLIAARNRSECCHEYRHPADTSIWMMALNSACLPSFTKKDLQYFKIFDTHAKTDNEISDLSLLEGMHAVNPKRDSLFAALAVLTKSAAALLVSRKLKAIPTQWEVLAIPYISDSDEMDFDDLFGQTQPFDVELKAWVGELETDDFLVIYRAKHVVVFFLFRFSATRAAWNRMLSRCPDATRLCFFGTQLKQVINYAWKQV